MRLPTLALFFVLSACSPSPEATSDAGVPDTSTTPQPDDGSPDVASSNTGTERWDGVDSNEAANLQAQLEAALTNTGLHGAAFGVAHGGERTVWSGAAGTLGPDGDQVWAADRQVRIGSVTKTFTTAIVLQLVDEGRLSLDDSLETWVPGYYDGEGIKIRHLLTNSSGIVSYNYVGSFDDTRPWTPTELVEWAVTHEPELRFEPGRQWEYSNTNFVLAGLVIEAVTAGTYADALTTRLLVPLGLDDTYLASSGDDNARIVPSWDESGAPLAADPSFGWAAGAIVSTPADLVRWGALLYGGDVLSEQGTLNMVSPALLTEGETYYGMGTFIEGDETTTIVGHTGGIAGFLTYMNYWVEGDVCVVAVSNIRQTDLRDLSAYAWSVVMSFDYP